MEELAFWLVALVALLVAAFLGFHRKMLLTVPLTVLLVVVLGVFATWADLRVWLGGGPDGKMAQAVVWLGITFFGLVCGIGWVIGRTASFVWSRIR
jgi:hypothetical protein